MHPNSLQDYIIEKTNISGKMVKAQVQSGATAQEAMQPSRAETVCFVRTRILRSKLSTFIGKEPWPTIQESLLKIMWQLLCAGRASNQIAAPMARSSTEAAPHTKIPHPNYQIIFYISNY